MTGVDARSACLRNVSSIGGSPDGSVYLATQSRIFKIDSDGIITVFAGVGASSFSGDGGPAIKAGVGDYIRGIAFDAAGNLYFADYRNNRIRKIDTNGIISTIAGNGQTGYTGDGGPAESAALSQPNGLRFDAAGALYIADGGGRADSRVRKIGLDGTISTFVGTFNNLSGLDFDKAGNLYVLEGFGQGVRRISPDGKTITRIAGENGAGFRGDGGPALMAQFNFPGGIRVDRAGKMPAPRRSRKSILQS